MNNPTPDEKENPVVTLKAQTEKLDFNKLRVPKGNKGANSGATMYADFRRMRFAINGKSIDVILNLLH